MVAAGIALVLMTVVVGAQVFSRYALNFSLTFAEPMAIQLMGWFIFLGAAVGVRENFHLGLDLLRYLAPPSVNRLLDTVSPCRSSPSSACSSPGTAFSLPPEPGTR